MAMPSVVRACAALLVNQGSDRSHFAVVDGVAELVEHGVHPPLARLDVAEHPNVALAIDVDAERVLALAVACVEVALREDGPDVEAEAVVGAQRERLEIGVGEEVIDRDPPSAGGLWKNGSSRCHGRRSSTEWPNRAASESSTAAFHSANGAAVTRLTSSSVANSRASSSSPVASASAKWSR